MDTRLNHKDYRVIVICVVLAIVSLFFITKYFYQAFPEASIEFKVTKSQSRVVADSFLKKISFDPQGYRHSAIFSYDSEAKTFLEKELGAEKANDLMSGQVRLWYWSNRWYRPLQKEEMRVNISSKGELLGFSHLISEEAPGAHISADSAKVLARRFLTQVMGLQPERLEFLEQSSEERPNRLDHTFLWKIADFEVREATYRYRVNVQGDQIGAYQEFLHVPEKWARDYVKLRSKNETTGQFSALLLFLTLGAMLVMLIVHTRHRDIRWKTAIIFGCVAFALSFFSTLNELPITQFNYPTTEAFESFIARQILGSLINGLLIGFLILFVTAAAEPLYRERFGQQISLSNTFRWKGMRTKKFFLAMIVGLSMTFIFGAYQVVFYLVSQKLGGWAPQDVPYDNLLNTQFPWIYILFMGFLPSVSEEFISRMFSIPFFEKILKSRWLAVIIPAFIWGFAHANYPQQPFYIRGLEVGLAGILVGLVMLRFGILAALVWHYTVDALYTAILLLRSGNTYLIITAAIGCGLLLLPLIIALVSYVKKRGFVPDEQLTNSHEGISRIEQPLPDSEKMIPQYRPLAARRIIIGLVVSGLLLGFFAVKKEKFGDFVRFTISKDEAKAKAGEILKKMSFDLTDYRHVVFHSERFDPIVAKYVLSHGGISRLNRLYDRESAANRWSVRFFKPLEVEEYQVNIDPRDARLVSLSRTVGEDAPGREVSQDSARHMAASFARVQGLIVDELVLKEISSEKLKNRTDHVFEWEAPDSDPRNVLETKFRVRVEIQGDKVSLFTTYPKVPENYRRDRAKKTFLNTLLLVLQLSLVGAFFVLGVIRFIKAARGGKIQWKRILIITGVVTLLFLCSLFLNYNQMLRQYPTTIDLRMFQLSMLIGVVLTSLGIAILLSLALGLITALYPESLNLFRREERRLFARDALLTALIFALGWAGIQQAESLLLDHFSSAALVNGLPLPRHLDSTLPAFTLLFQAFLKSAFLACFLGIVAFIFKHLLNKPIWIGLFALWGLVAIVPGDARATNEILLHHAMVIPALLWTLAIAVGFLRNNPLTYFIAPFFYLVLADAIPLFRQDDAFLRWNGVAAVIALALFTIWLILPAFKRAER